MPTTLDSKHQEGVLKLMDAMTAKGVNVTEAVGVSDEDPKEVEGVQPAVVGTVAGKPAIGLVTLIEDVTKESTKSAFHRLGGWAEQNQAKLFAGVIGKPGKGFHGVEQAVQVEALITSGWDVNYI